MPYADPLKAREHASLRQKRYAERHPERIKERSRKWYARNSEYARLKAAAWKAVKIGAMTRDEELALQRGRKGGGTKNAHGLTANQYHGMLAQQNGKCALCFMEAPLCVDHEHVDGWEQMPPVERAKHVRGLLCAACNTFIGRCREDVDVILKKTQNIAANVANYLGRKP